MKTFIFEKYLFDKEKFSAEFHYAFDDGQKFVERFQFAKPDGEIQHDAALLERALFLAHILVGASYYKTFPVVNVQIKSGKIDQWQARFFDTVFQEGLSQFAYENNLTRADLAHFVADVDDRKTALNYNDRGVLALQSGGKDSLLVAAMLQETGTEFMPWFISNGKTHPRVLDELKAPLQVAYRTIDKENLGLAAQKGAANGHVPITYIVESLAIAQAVIFGNNTVLAAIAHEGAEPATMIGDLPVNHQWSKTWHAEQNLSEYVRRYISSQIKVESPLRQFSELAVAELFVKKCWKTFARKFSSCNVANYSQGGDNVDLRWCGKCAKCANSWLLFAPFVNATDLKNVFGVEIDLFAKSELTEIFKGLLGVGGVQKPFECVGEIAELRKAYHMAQARGDYAKLPFVVPESDFDMYHNYESAQSDIIDVVNKLP